MGGFENPFDNVHKKNKEELLKEEIELVRGKIEFLHLPKDLQDGINGFLERFEQKNTYDKIGKIKNLLMEMDMMINYRALLTQKFRETGDENAIKEGIEDIMKKAGASLAEIHRILIDNDDHEPTVQ